MTSVVAAPQQLRGQLDLVVAVVPYVPTASLALLPHDTLTFEDVAHYDGGPDGTALLARLAAESPAYLRPGGRLILSSEATRPNGWRHCWTGWAMAPSTAGPTRKATSGASRPSSPE